MQLFVVAKVHYKKRNLNNILYKIGKALIFFLQFRGKFMNCEGLAGWGEATFSRSDNFDFAVARGAKSNFMDSRIVSRRQIDFRKHSRKRRGA